MSEYDLDNDTDVLETEDNGDASSDSRQFVRNLEKQAKAGKAAVREADEAKAEANAAKRELALMKAGIDLNSPTGKLFVKAYDGEISVEAIKAAAGEYGLIATSQIADVANDLASLDRVSQASSGSTANVPPSVLDEIRNAQSPDEVLKLLAANNVSITRDQPGGWFPI